MSRDSKWIDSHSITGLQFGVHESPSYDAATSAPNCPASIELIREHLEHQLYERRQFVPGADLVVAALMFDLANAAALTRTAEEATPIYIAARNLGYPNLALVAKRITFVERLRDSNFLSGWTVEMIALSIVGAFIFLGTGVALALLLYRANLSKRLTR